MALIYSGIDEAGRGCIIGPLIIAGVSLANKDLIVLKNKGLDDSKSFSGVSGRRKRTAIAKMIEQLAIETFIIEISPAEIDKALYSTSTNLNLLEINNIAKLITKLKGKKMFIDVVSNPEKMYQLLKRDLQEMGKDFSQIISKDKQKLSAIVEDKTSMSNNINNRQEVTLSIKGDKLYPIVSAASCIAKTIRDERVTEIETEFGVKVGSGYPHYNNKELINFLAEHKEEINKKKFPFIRYSWKWSPLQQILEKPPTKLDVFLQKNDKEY